MNYWKLLNCIINHCIYGLSNNAPKKFRKTPSNASIFTKRFRHIDFWTSFLSISQNFFDSCANSNRKNNKIILCINHVKTRA